MSGECSRVKSWKVFRIGTVRYNWPMSAHASQAFSIAHCTDSEDLSKLSGEISGCIVSGRTMWWGDLGMGIYRSGGGG